MESLNTSTPLMAISPLDGRYAKAMDSLRPFFSEYALMRYRVKVELQWLRKLFTDKIVTQDSEKLDILKNNDDYLNKIFDDFSEKDGLRVKEIEKTTNHDVKAIEYFLKEKFDQGPEGLSKIKEYLHFSCTSEDINNLSYALMMSNALKEVLIPKLLDLQNHLYSLAKEYADVPMMCRTHGQSATPSTIGKEMANFAYRLSRQVKKLA